VDLLDEVGMMTGKSSLLCITAIVVIISVAATGAGIAGDGVIVQEPELVVQRQGNIETCALPGDGYRAFSVDDNSASFLVEERLLPAGHKRIAGHGIQRVSWEPVAGDTLVTVEFKAPPSFTLINAVDGTELRPTTPQVIAGFGFEPKAETGYSYPVLGSRKPGQHVEEDAHGAYKLPELPPVKYSDALVTLKVENVDFRDVLWLMSEIGNVSIMLDPYWADEPTGSTRPPGAGADPGSGSGGGDGGGGFRGAGDFIPFAPRTGTGRLSLNFIDVPFDTALELILMSVGLVKVDIYPGSFD